MAEFDANGEVPFKEGWQHGRSLSMQELADRQGTLEQIGSLVHQLVMRVPRNQRAAFLQRTNYVSDMTVWDHEHTPPLVQRVPLNKAQEVLDAGHEIHKTDALLAREWLDRTRRFLLEALTSLGQDSASA